MLAIRLQRTGRTGHTQFRMVVQDSRFSPKRGRVVAYLGSYDPHTKATTIDGEKASQYLSNGAQPSDRVARLLQKEGIKLPGWVKLDQPQTGATRNPDKRRSTRAPEAAAPEPVKEESAEDQSVSEPAAKEPASTEPEATTDSDAPTEPASTDPEPAAEENPTPDDKA